MRRMMFNLKFKLRSFIYKVKAGMIHALGGVTKLESAQMAMNDRYTRRDIQIKTARYTQMIEFRDTSPDYFKCYVESFKICVPSEIGRYLAEKGAITFKREERDGAIVLTAEAKYIASQDAYGPDRVMLNQII